MLLLGLLSIPLVLGMPNPQIALPVIGVCEMVYLSGLFLARRGRVILSAWLLISVWLFSNLATPISTGQVISARSFCPVPS